MRPSPTTLQPAPIQLRAPSSLRVEASDLCWDVGLLLDLDEPASLETGATIGGERVLLVCDEDLDDGVHIFLDAGAIAPDSDVAQLLCALMEVNLELSPAQGESFGMDHETGRILFRAFVPDGHFTAHSVAHDIRRYVGLMHELRQGPLSGCVRDNARAS